MEIMREIGEITSDLTAYWSSHPTKSCYFSCQ